MSKIWKLISDVQVQRGPEGSFIFIFEDVKERDEVLEEEPWHLDNNILILKKWPPDKSFQALDFSTTGFWLQGILPGIAMENSMVILPLHLGLVCGLAKSPNPHPYQRTLHLQSHFNKTQVPNASAPSLLLDLPSDQVVCSSGMGLYSAVRLLNTQSIPTSSPPSDPSTHINCLGTKKQSLTAAESVGVPTGLEAITLLKDLHAKGKDLCSPVFLNPSSNSSNGHRQAIEIAADNNNHQIESSRKEKISLVY
ncbi:hypothetical protein GH714_032295 [Hevea brasiliensis]|uniref:DUF4283 domain-containing protein n=1 Tax=Hevea brasiliensis TaxID=3981 RepID=A0A6A6LER9_HEVBR|nr:hypothetical protein GH714_032295 [Hevea brasiliensis]